MQRTPVQALSKEIARKFQGKIDETLLSRYDSPDPETIQFRLFLLKGCTFPMPKLAHEIYSFDEFQLDLTRGCLFRGTLELKLRPQSFEVLKYLTQNPGRLISKDELITSVWGGMAVTDDSLVQCMKDIRNTLGETGQEIIRTVPRRGYIFECDVTENGSAVYVGESSGVRVVIEETEDTNGKVDATRYSDQPVVRRRSLKGALKRHKIATIFITAGLVSVVIAGIVFYRPIVAWWFKPPSIAVLPVVNATGDRSLDYVTDGLTESIITSLAQLNELGKASRVRVIAQNTVFMFKGKEVDPGSVGRELGVERVLASKMLHQSGLRIIKLELINIEDGSVIWNKQYASTLTNPSEFLAMQNEIPRDVAAQMPLSLSDSDRENLTRRYTKNAEAYDLFLKGRAEFRKVVPSALRRSIELYQQAIDLDPNFAAAYWAIGMAYKSLGNIDELSDKESAEKAIDMFQKALKIDNNLTVANNSLELSKADVWDWKSIEKAGPTHPGYERYLGAMGRLEERLESERRRLANNPYAPFLNFTHCNTLLGLRRPDEAIAQCRKTLNIVPAADKAYFGPESPWIHLYLSLAYSLKKMYPEAETELKTAIELGENSKTLLAELGAVFANSGQRAEAIKILEHLQDRERNGEYAPSLNISHIYIALGNKDQAFLWLNRAIDEREDRAVDIKYSDTYDPLRDDARFGDLLRRMNLAP
jgi:DNA-binding winged helix-turn-helix (wHTH) protein/TolB-like protein